ncbi:MAG: phosphatidylserine decarboxylase [Acholeplasma sp.]|nr:phosphatidylserine decarboxylase [Acholeplasma sp.]
MNSFLSKVFIKSFVRKHEIDLSIYEKQTFKSYNDFFTRKLKKINFNDSDNVLISPCDAKLLVARINKSRVYRIKNTHYYLEDILNDSLLAKEYENGHMLIYRLEVTDYHRYIFIDEGDVISTKKIKGRLHTVNPIAFRKYDVYKENAREVSVLNTKNFGKIVQVEVGALMVGKIKNYEINSFKRSEEKGLFLFGGSTIIVLVKENQVIIDEDLLANSQLEFETMIKIGERVGIKRR